MRIYWFWPHPHLTEILMARAAMRNGDELTVHSFSSWGGEAIESTFDSYRVIRELPEPQPKRVSSASWAVSRTKTYLKTARLRRSEVSIGRYDICHVFNLNYFIDPWALPALGRASQLVSTVHDVIPHQGRLPRTIERRVLRRMYECAGRLVVAHIQLSNHLQAEFAVPPERISVVPLPIRQIDISHDSERNDQERFVVLFFGRLRRNKGVGVLLDAIALLAERDIVFQFAGSGPVDVVDMIQTAAGGDPRIKADLRWITPAEKDHYFRRADLVVLPYTSFASQSGVLGDSYSYGVPVVASDVGALGPSVRTDRSGWVVPPSDAAALADAILIARSDDLGRGRAAANSLDVGRSRSPERIGLRLRQIYDELSMGS